MLIIDRFEGEIAVLEDFETGGHTQVKRSLFPDYARESDVVELGENGAYTVNSTATEKRRSEVLALMNKMGLMDS
jgi:hypothetical protein